MVRDVILVQRLQRQHQFLLSLYFQNYGSGWIGRLSPSFSSTSNKICLLRYFGNSEIKGQYSLNFLGAQKFPALLKRRQIPHTKFRQTAVVSCSVRTVGSGIYPYTPSQGDMLMLLHGESSPPLTLWVVQLCLSSVRGRNCQPGYITIVTVLFLDPEHKKTALVKYTISTYSTFLKNVSR